MEAKAMEAKAMEAKAMEAKAMEAEATPLLKFIKDNQKNQLVTPSIRGCIAGKRSNAKNYGMIL
ncbi:hypothetical protein JP0168_13380 [Helicobacter pylori]